MLIDTYITELSATHGFVWSWYNSGIWYNSSYEYIIIISKLIPPLFNLCPRHGNKYWRCLGKLSGLAKARGYEGIFPFLSFVNSHLVNLYFVNSH